MKFCFILIWFKFNKVARHFHFGKYFHENGLIRQHWRDGDKKKLQSIQRRSEMSTTIVLKKLKGEVNKFDWDCFLLLWHCRLFVATIHLIWIIHLLNCCTSPDYLQFIWIISGICCFSWTYLFAMHLNLTEQRWFSKGINEIHDRTWTVQGHTYFLYR